MSSQEVFLKEICNDPANLDARSVYADWLLEQGDPRGRFIAEQIQLSKMSQLDESYPELLAGTRRLEAEYADQWLSRILKLINIERETYGRVEIDPRFNAQFKNGFIERIAMKPEQVDAIWSELRSIEPIQGAELLVQESISDEAANVKSAANFRNLKISPEGWVTAYAISRVLNWGLENLEELDLSGCDLKVDGIKLLANQKTDLGDFFEDFNHPPPLQKKLRLLWLKNTGIGDEGAKILLNWQGAHQLENLDLSQCGISDAATFKALANLERLETLFLAGNNGADLESLSAWKGLQKLKMLALPQTTSPTAFKSIFKVASENLIGLQLAGAKELLAEPDLISSASHRFAELHIGSTSVGDKNFAKLIAADSLQSVVHLILNKCSLSDSAIMALTESGLARLVTLDISSNKLSDAALKQLAQWPGLKHITHLRTRNNRKLTGAGYAALIDAEFFQPSRFDVGKCKEKETEAKLRERFGSAMIFS